MCARVCTHSHIHIHTHTRTHTHTPHIYAHQICMHTYTTVIQCPLPLLSNKHTNVCTIHTHTYLRYTNTHTHKGTCMHMHKQICYNTHTQICLSLSHTHTHPHPYTHTHTNMSHTHVTHTHTHVTHTYAHTHTHTHTAQMHHLKCWHGHSPCRGQHGMVNTKVWVRGCQLPPQSAHLTRLHTQCSISTLHFLMPYLVQDE